MLNEEDVVQPNCTKNSGKCIDEKRSMCLDFSEA